ncbi:MAG TPA: DUF3549 family protein [Thiothrix sp.]|nr:DUF3549 family protein [Thiothrix sp.]
MTDPVTIDNISTFFELSQFNYRVFDMSRTVQPISNEMFKEIETQKSLYPTPFQQHAWLGILFWHPEDVKEPAIWFLKFPLDELGFLKLEARDSFIQEMLEQVGNKIKEESTTGDNEVANKESTEKKSAQEESQFAFKPQQDKMAIFNAFATRALEQNPSKYYSHTQEYLAGKLGYDQWSFLGFQGLADVAANLDIDDNMQAVAKAIPAMPEHPLTMFSQLLEHATPNAEVSQALLDKMDNELSADQPNIALISSLARGLSASQQSSEAIKHLLESPLNTDIEILALIASRAWNTLKDPTLLKSYLEALAQQEQRAFDVILMELLPIPDMRDILLTGLRDSDRSEDLTQRIGGFMQRFSS